MKSKMFISFILISKMNIILTYAPKKLRNGL